jgi:hypothetical protein
MIRNGMQRAENRLISDNKKNIFLVYATAPQWEPCSTRAVGRQRPRWLDQVEEDIKKMKVRNWREKCKDRRLWNEIVKQAKTQQRL